MAAGKRREGETQARKSEQSPLRVPRHESVRALLEEMGGDDPEAAIRSRARALIDELRSAFAWEGPPFDLAALASYQGFQVTSVDGLSPGQDACIMPGQIALNIQKPRRRQRYSLAHEIVHTLFPDYKEQLRKAGALYREESTTRSALLDPSEEELEELCQIGAAELLLPRFAFEPELHRHGVSLATIIKLSENFDASLEATARRVVELNTDPLVVAFLGADQSASGAVPSGRDYSPFVRLRVNRVAISPLASGYRSLRNAIVPRTSVAYKAWKRASHPQSASDVYSGYENWTEVDDAALGVRCSAMALPRRSATPHEVLVLMETHLQFESS